MDTSQTSLSSGTLAWIGVGVTLAYYALIFLAIRVRRKERVQVVRYTPPEGVSPGAIAWLLERGELPRAIVATLLHLASKGVLSLKRSDGVYEMQRLTTPPQPLLPEEKAIMYAWFRTGNVLTLPAGPTEMKRGVDEFGKTIESFLNPTYFTKNSVLYMPAWILSAAIAVIALLHGGILDEGNQGQWIYFVPYAFLAIWGCLVVASHGLARSPRKIATYLPGRDVPKTPLCKADVLPLGLLSLSFFGIILLAAVSSVNAACVSAALLAINAVFFRALWGPTSAGRQLIHEIEDYRKFLSEVDSDPVSRTQWPDGSLLEMTEKAAYAVALGIDLGWGEQFVAAVANWVDSAEVFLTVPDMLDNPRDPFAEMNLK